MSIEIIEETENTEAIKPTCDFLPPVAVTVRRSGRSAFAIVINIALLLTSGMLCVCGLSIGAPVLLLACALLTVEIIGFVKSKGTVGGYGLILRRNAYLISAVLLFGIAFFCESYEPYYQYCAALEPLFEFSEELPKPFCDIFGIGFMGEFFVCSALGTMLLAIGLNYGSLNRSKHKNTPPSKAVFCSFALNLLATAVLVCDGLERLNILPSGYKYEDWIQSLVIAKYCDVGICFGFGVVALLSAIRMLVIFIRMRKVKNAVFKA